MSDSVSPNHSADQLSQSIYMPIYRQWALFGLFFECGEGSLPAHFQEKKEIIDAHESCIFFTYRLLLDFTQEPFNGTVAVSSFASSINMFGDDEAVMTRIWLPGRIHVKQYVFCEL
jgi:hypothetical protein